MCLRRSLAGSAGFTLIEVVVAVGIISLAVGMIGGGLFNVHSIQGFWRDNVVATYEVRRATSRFAEDALQAENVIDPEQTGEVRLACNPGSPPSSVNLTWTDTGGVSHTTIYSVSAEELVRVHDGITLTVARQVAASSVSFSLCGSLLTFNLGIKSGKGATESMRTQTYLRRLLPE